MKLTKKALLYDISNIAYVIADSYDDDTHKLHQVRDICQEGNIDRVSRILGLAYAKITDLFTKVIEIPPIDLNRDFTANVHDYRLDFRENCFYHRLAEQRKLKIKELCREFMVCMVLYDWIGFVLPDKAEVWRQRMERCYNALKEIAEEAEGWTGAYRRKISPI